MAKELKTNNMPNLKKNPDGMKPSGFKMKNSALHKSAKYGSPMHANYGAKSPVKKTYKEAYADADKTKYDTYEKFETAAKAYNTKKYGTTEPTKEAKELKRNYSDVTDVKSGKKKLAAMTSYKAKEKTKTKTTTTPPPTTTTTEKTQTVKEAKAAKVLARKKVRATRKKYGRGSDEVKAAKKEKGVAKEGVKTARKNRDETSTRKSRRLTNKVKKQTSTIDAEAQNSPKGTRTSDKRNITQAKLDLEKKKIAEGRA